MAARHARTWQLLAWLAAAVLFALAATGFAAPQPAGGSAASTLDEAESATGAGTDSSGGSDRAGGRAPTLLDHIRNRNTARAARGAAGGEGVAPAASDEDEPSAATGGAGGRGGGSLLDMLKSRMADSRGKGPAATQGGLPADRRATVRRSGAEDAGVSTTPEEGDDLGADVAAAQQHARRRAAEGAAGVPPPAPRRRAVKTADKWAKLKARTWKAAPKAPAAGPAGGIYGSSSGSSADGVAAQQAAAAQAADTVLQGLADVPVTTQVEDVSPSSQQQQEQQPQVAAPHSMPEPPARDLPPPPEPPAPPIGIPPEEQEAFYRIDPELLKPTPTLHAPPPPLEEPEPDTVVPSLEKAQAKQAAWLAARSVDTPVYVRTVTAVCAEFDLEAQYLAASQGLPPPPPQSAGELVPSGTCLDPELTEALLLDLAQEVARLSYGRVQLDIMLPPDDVDCTYHLGDYMEQMIVVAPPAAPEHADVPPWEAEAAASREEGGEEGADDYDEASMPNFEEGGAPAPPPPGTRRRYDGSGLPGGVFSPRVDGKWMAHQAHPHRRHAQPHLPHTATHRARRAAGGGGPQHHPPPGTYPRMEWRPVNLTSVARRLTNAVPFDEDETCAFDVSDFDHIIVFSRAPVRHPSPLHKIYDGATDPMLEYLRRFSVQLLTGSEDPIYLARDVLRTVLWQLGAPLSTRTDASAHAVQARRETLPRADPDAVAAGVEGVATDYTDIMGYGRYLFAHQPELNAGIRHGLGWIPDAGIATYDVPLRGGAAGSLPAATAVFTLQAVELPPRTNAADLSVPLTSVRFKSHGGAPEEWVYLTLRAAGPAPGVLTHRVSTGYTDPRVTGDVHWNAAGLGASELIDLAPVWHRGFDSALAVPGAAVVVSGRTGPSPRVLVTLLSLSSDHSQATVSLSLLPADEVLPFNSTLVPLLQEAAAAAAPPPSAALVEAAPAASAAAPPVGVLLEPLPPSGGAVAAAAAEPAPAAPVLLPGNASLVVTVAEPPSGAAAAETAAASGAAAGRPAALFALKGALPPVFNATKQMVTISTCPPHVRARFRYPSEASLKPPKPRDPDAHYAGLKRKAARRRNADGSESEEVVLEEVESPNPSLLQYHDPPGYTPYADGAEWNLHVAVYASYPWAQLLHGAPLWLNALAESNFTLAPILDVQPALVARSPEEAHDARPVPLRALPPRASQEDIAAGMPPPDLDKNSPLAAVAPGSGKPQPGTMQFYLEEMRHWVETNMGLPSSAPPAPPPHMSGSPMPLVSGSPAPHMSLMPSISAAPMVSGVPAFGDGNVLTAPLSADTLRRGRGLATHNAPVGWHIPDAGASPFQEHGAEMMDSTSMGHGVPSGFISPYGAPLLFPVMATPDPEKAPGALSAEGRRKLDAMVEKAIQAGVKELAELRARRRLAAVEGSTTTDLTPRMLADLEAEVEAELRRDMASTGRRAAANDPTAVDGVSAGVRSGGLDPMLVASKLMAETEEVYRVQAPLPTPEPPPAPFVGRDGKIAGEEWELLVHEVEPIPVGHNRTKVAGYDVLPCGTVSVPLPVSGALYVLVSAVPRSGAGAPLRFHFTTAVGSHSKCTGEHMEVVVPLGEYGQASLPVRIDPEQPLVAGRPAFKARHLVPGMHELLDTAVYFREPATPGAAAAAGGEGDRGAWVLSLKAAASGASAVYETAVPAAWHPLNLTGLPAVRMDDVAAPGGEESPLVSLPDAFVLETECACTEGTWLLDGPRQCFACPAMAHAPPFSKSIAHCSCEAGATMPAELTMEPVCSVCPAGYLIDPQRHCVKCPPFTTTEFNGTTFVSCEPQVCPIVELRVTYPGAGAAVDADAPDPVAKRAAAAVVALDEDGDGSGSRSGSGAPGADAATAAVAGASTGADALAGFTPTEATKWLYSGRFKLASSDPAFVASGLPTTRQGYPVLVHEGGQAYLAFSAATKRWLILPTLADDERAMAGWTSPSLAEAAPSTWFAFDGAVFGSLYCLCGDGATPVDFEAGLEASCPAAPAALPAVHLSPEDEAAANVMQAAAGGV